MKDSEISYNRIRKDFLIVNLVVGVTLVLVLLLLYLQQKGFIPAVPCRFLSLTGLYCIGCGGTRAFAAFCRGDLVQSLYYNPAVVLGVLLILYYEIGVSVTLLRKNGKYYYHRGMGLAIGYLIILIVFSVIRDYLLLVQHVDLLG